MFGFKPHSTKSLDGASAFFVYLFFLLLCLFLYRLGWSGGWHFDDAPNLGGLSSVYAQGQFNGSAALGFVFSGDAGPLGRAVALASFLLDGSGWPFHPEEMLYTNSLLHVLNGTLLFAVIFYLVRLLKCSIDQASWVAALSAGIWLVLPLSVSSSLMVVQRMTTLSSSFMLLGFLFYILGRSQLGAKKWRCWLWMTGGLAGGTLLGVLTKEQAVTLPLLVWVTEVWLLPKPAFDGSLQQRLWLVFRVVFFYLPACLIAAYLLRIVLNADNAYASRDFDLLQRLWTQSVVLWDYLFLGLFPRASALGPFHDDYQVYDFGLVAVTAVLGWVVVFLVSFFVRKKTMLPMFALLWFWVAHVVESTVVPLELYFEHRNYLALIGVVVAFVFFIFQWGMLHNKVVMVRFTVISYAGLLLAVLFQVTSLFGRPELAAEMWYIQHPNSVRASQYVAHQYAMKNELNVSLRILDETAGRLTDAAALSLQGLQLACVLNRPRSELERRFDQVLKDISGATHRFAITETLGKLKILSDDKSCGGFIQWQYLQAIVQAALDNSSISASAVERSNLHVFLALHAIEVRDLEQTMGHLLSALEAFPQTSTLKLTAGVLRSAGISQEMTEILHAHQPEWPLNPFLRKKMQKDWEEINSLVVHGNS